MFAEDFTNLVNERLAHCKKLLGLKGADYASKKDRLHNFKVGAALCRQTPEQFALDLMAKHIVAMSDKIVNKEKMSVEFVADKFSDIINYVLLIEALNEERK